ncbi:glycosyltransferase (plasmid) [Halorussus limi]|uniref:Glycosyltransferase n=1 Tax=Halorussus limi TaxID=2938695 RepID=A0A8U0I0J2_9EURY|nr:glycosyltransferase [Halorussus limi]UPV76659.1 glycosyltransferase [Halorussus limi]
MCHVLNALGDGGVQNLLLNMVERSESNVEHSISYLNELETSLEPAFRARGVRTTDASPGGQFDPRAIPALARHARENDVDVLHAHLPWQQVVARLASLATDAVVVSTHHNLGDNTHPAVATAERATRPLDAATVAVSEAVRDRHAGRWLPGEDGWRVVHNGIDVPGFREEVRSRRVDGEVRDSASAAPRDTDETVADGGADERDSGGDADERTSDADERSLSGNEQNPTGDERNPADDAADEGGTTFLHVGRYIPGKSQIDLLHAMARVVEDHPDSHLYLVGWGDLEASLRDAADRLGVGANVSVTGYQSDVEAYYAMADAFVSSSLSEGFPITYIEAMAAELPVVSTAFGGAADIVADSETGFVVPTRDREGLAEAMLALESPETRREMGRAGYERAADLFDVGRTAAEYRRIYRESLGATAGTPD